MTEKMILVRDGTHFPSYHGARGSIELLPLGTVERECAARGERIYKTSELGELLAELKAGPPTGGPSEPRLAFVVYTDGSGTTSGPGGIAYVALDAAGEFIREESLPLKECTNQKAEILAAAYALHRLPEGSAVTVISDSEYLVKGFTEWLPAWLANNWRKRTGGVAKNQSHWQRLHDAAERHELVTFEWCRGHDGIEWNERADVLAGQARAEAKRQAGVPSVPEVPKAPGPPDVITTAEEMGALVTERALA